ncbi:MAG: hypothetical protein Unbinned1524contig1000_70 [Prokaryotic dsDNA virus sp.]|nr:MAG: hypothetical protein Unbinned1524contig1000_70 [Prokaryotic dsDNA virus sp.]|tara:strand:- start:1024 stop:1176 length:153 start_codon:yes stop_codon:yes gene_type:complete
MNKQKHTYQEDFEIGVEYSYDKDYKKVYDIEKLKRRFKHIIDSLKNKRKW